MYGEHGQIIDFGLPNFSRYVRRRKEWKKNSRLKPGKLYTEAIGQLYADQKVVGALDE